MNGAVEDGVGGGGGGTQIEASGGLQLSSESSSPLSEMISTESVLMSITVGLDGKILH